MQCQSALAAAEAVSNLALRARALNGIARTQYWNGDDPPTAIRNAEANGMPAYHPDQRKTFIRRSDILSYFTGFGY